MTTGAVRSLSIVIPAFNEAKRLPPTLQACRIYLDGIGIPFEIIVVDDGSSDGTAAVACSFPGVRVISLDRNRGKGAAVRTGMLGAGCDWALVMDADHSLNIRLLERFWPFTETADVLVGSRKSPNAQLDRNQRALRRILGKCFSVFSVFVTGVGLEDFTCGFKLFRQAALEPVFRRQRIDGWGYDAEIMAIANLMGYRIYSIPVVWTDVPGTKVHLLRDTCWSLFELSVILVNRILGVYRIDPSGAENPRRNDGGMPAPPAARSS